VPDALHARAERARARHERARVRRRQGVRGRDRELQPEGHAELAAAKKETYLRSYPRPGAAAGWHFLTGDQAEIAALTRAIGFRYRWVAEQRQYAHAAGIVVATPQGRLARYFYGLEYSARDLRLGLVEASQGKIGSPVDTVLLYCFAYDPRVVPTRRRL